MTRIVIDHGICGFETKIDVEKNPDYTVTAIIESTCPNLSLMPSELLTFDPVMEMTSAGTLNEKLAKYITHRSCLLVSGLIKAAEAEAGLALKKDACIRFVE